MTGVSADVDAAGGTASVPSADVWVRTRQSASLPANVRTRQSASLPAGAPQHAFPVRKWPSKNSVLARQGDRAVILFVTVTSHRRQSVFANDEASTCILMAWRQAQNWLVGRYVIMPDHVHFFCAPGQAPVPDFHRWVAYWKSLVARNFPREHELPLWQRECWDVQMRTVGNYREKWNYVRNNPVRKGLVADAEDWPYQGFENVLAWHD